MKERTAKCHCGQLQITVRGEPLRNVMCHCGLCQRRTGSAFHLASWFDDKDVLSKEGEEKIYYRQGDTKIGMTFHFCTTCGSSVYWTSDRVTGVTGVASGCFADRNFPPPEVSIFAECRHPWVSLPDGTPSFRKGRDGDPE